MCNFDHKEIYSFLSQENSFDFVGTLENHGYGNRALLVKIQVEDYNYESYPVYGV